MNNIPLRASGLGEDGEVDFMAVVRTPVHHGLLLIVPSKISLTDSGLKILLKST